MSETRPFGDLIKAIRNLRKQKSPKSDSRIIDNTMDGISMIRYEADSMLENVLVIHPQPSAKHTATVIFLHGSGGGNGGLQRHLALQASPDMGHVKWIIPQVRLRPLTIARGRLLPSWYDIYQNDDRQQGPWDYDGMSRAINTIHDLIREETTDDDGPMMKEENSSRSRIPSRRLVIAGLSQGGATTVWSGLTYDKQLGGMAIFSALLEARDRFTDKITPHARSLPVFQAHGALDKVVPLRLGEELHGWLKDIVGMEDTQNGEGIIPVGIRYHKYEDLEHAIHDEEWEDFGRWLNLVIPEES